MGKEVKLQDFLTTGVNAGEWFFLTLPQQLFSWELDPRGPTNMKLGFALDPN
jgi:hypothetical protein